MDNPTLKILMVGFFPLDYTEALRAGGNTVNTVDTAAEAFQYLRHFPGTDIVVVGPALLDLSIDEFISAVKAIKADIIVEQPIPSPLQLIETLRRKFAGESVRVIRLGDLKLDTVERRLTIGRFEPVDIPLRQFELLLYLMQSPNMTLMRETVQKAMGINSDNNLNQLVSRLKSEVLHRSRSVKLENVRSLGYRLSGPAE